MPSPHLLTPRVQVDERPAPGRPSQDRHLVLPHAVVVLDGASDPREPRGRDGGWYADQLREALQRELIDPGSMPTAVEAAIRSVSTRHGLVPGAAPSCTVAAVAWDDSTVNAYVLGDSTVVIDLRDDSPQVISDRRLSEVATDVRAEYRQALTDGRGYDGAHRDRLRRLVEVERQHRNSDAGYWIAEASPAAARHGLTATWPRDAIRTALLATDGAAAAVDTYAVIPDWTTALALSADHGPGVILDAAEAAEVTDPQATRWPRSKQADDKTMARITLA